MSVLTLSGKPIDWAHPPKATAKVLWSRRSVSGKRVTGSLYAIAHLDHMNTLSMKKFGQPILVIQPPYNTGVVASAGTHDLDMCSDGYIPGVPWLEAQAFMRANGAGAYYRSPAQGFSPHIHWFTLPPQEGSNVSDDYRASGFEVGKFVDGGYSTVGRKVASSQIEDYYLHRNALAGHAPDPTWFPSVQKIFNLDAYITKQRKVHVATPARRRIFHDSNYARGNSRVGDRRAAEKKLFADRDVQPARGGRLYVTHWPHPKTEGFADPGGKIPKRGFRKLPGRKIRSLRTEKGGYRIRSTQVAMSDAKKTKVPGIEFDLKIVPTQAQMNRLAKEAKSVWPKVWRKKIYVKMSTLGAGSNGKWKTALARAKKAGFNTIVIRYSGNPADLPRYVDQFRRP